MKRSHLVATGTLAGIATVVGFSVHHPTTALSAGSTSGSTSSTGTAGVASPSAATGASSGAVTPTTAAPAAPTTSGAPTTTVAATRTATGTDESFRYGDIAVKVTLTGNKITRVTVASLDETDGRSVQIDNYAVPQLEQEVIDANSANVDSVSGATYTSEAFVQSLGSALSKLGFNS